MVNIKAEREMKEGARCLDLIRSILLKVLLIPRLTADNNLRHTDITTSTASLALRHALLGSLLSLLGGGILLALLEAGKLRPHAR